MSWQQIQIGAQKRREPGARLRLARWAQKLLYFRLRNAFKPLNTPDIMIAVLR